MSLLRKFPSTTAEWSGVVRGNQTLGTILSLLQTGTDEDGVVAAMRERYDAPDGKVERDVACTIEELRRIGALDE